METKERFTLFALFAAATALLSSFLFGFQTAIISGALASISSEFSLSVAEQGFLVSIALLAALFGVVIAGVFADYLGRKKTLIFSALLFCLGSCFSTISPSYFLLLLARTLTGAAVGMVSMTTPLYLAEISTSKQRGRFVAAHQLLISIGILSAYGINHHFEPNGLWRLMFFSGIVPSALQLVLLFFITESPSWLLCKDKQEHAYRAYARLRSDTLWESSLVSLSSFAKEKMASQPSSLLLSRKVIKIILIGISLSMFQQITGINTIIYYVPKIFSQPGLAQMPLASYAALCVGTVNMIATLISMRLIDTLGRRRLLIIGMVAMFFSMQILSLCSFFASAKSSYFAAFSIMAFVASFAIGIGPVTMVCISELYPLKIRGKAMSIATCANWLFNYIVTFSFLPLLHIMGIEGIFQLFAALCLLALAFIYFFIPETKGKSLEEIEASLH